MKRNRQCRSGFSVSEFLVVLVLAAVFLAILLPVLGQSGERSRAAKCIVNLRGIGILLSLYANDHQARLPVAHETVDGKFTVWHQTLWPYSGGGQRLEDHPIFFCPSRGVDLYSYAFERRASKGRLADLARNLEGNQPVLGRRWLVMDANWYFMERSHGVNGPTGTAKITALRHLRRANFLFPDFSVEALDQATINASLYIFKEYPIP